MTGDAKMTDRTKKIWGIIGWEFILLLVKLFVLAMLFVPVGLILFAILWDGSKGWGRFVAFFGIAVYYALSFFIIVWWPFHKYVYSRLSSRGKRWLWSFVAVMLAVASFMLFTYRTVDEHVFPAGKETFRVVVRDTYWNRMFRHSAIVPSSLFRDYDVTIYTANNELIGNYSRWGSGDYSVPHYFVDKEGTPVTRDGGYDLYLESPETTKLRHRKDVPVRKWTQIQRQLRKKFLEAGVTNNTLTIIPLPCSATEFKSRMKELEESRFRFHATVSTDGNNLIVTCPAEGD